ncbi:MAG: NADH-quinone oxidoreductase subunit NuoB [Bdellovibrionales bacterium]|nr:NADH-quinone oxidoreductase subunit NuoB [Bdellovibrionales bacterium]
MTAWATTRLQKLMSRLEAHSHAPWIMATGCCKIELESVRGATYDWSRLGIQDVADHPSQSDLLVVAGWINPTFKADLETVYSQLTGQKLVMAIGTCAISGAPYQMGSENAAMKVSDFLPVDIFVPGCPPRPEAMIDALRLLKKKLRPSEDHRELLISALKDIGRGVER